MAFGDSARAANVLQSLPLPAAAIGALESFFGGGQAATQRAALMAFVIRVASAGIAYLSQVFLARWMGSFEYGIFVFVWVWVLILGGLAPLGFSTTVVRFIPEYGESGREDLLRGLLLGAPLLSVGVATLTMVAVLACLATMGHMIEGYYVLPAVLMAFCLPMYTLVDVLDGVARGYGWIGTALLPPYILRPLLILATMVGAYFLGFPADAVTAAGAAVVACWLTAVVQTVSIRSSIGKQLPSGARRYEMGLWVRVSLPILLVASFDLILHNTDVLVLSRYMPPEQVAIYFAALKSMALVMFVHFAVGTAVAKHYSALKARNDEAALNSMVRRSVHWVFWPTLAGTAFILLLGQPLLWLFGEEFVSGYPVMFILAAGFLVHASVGPSEFVLNMLGEQNRCAVVLFAAALLNITLNFILIPQYGLTGAAFATAGSKMLAATLMAIIAWRRLGLSLFIAAPRHIRER